MKTLLTVRTPALLVALAVLGAACSSAADTGSQAQENVAVPETETTQSEDTAPSDAAELPPTRVIVDEAGPGDLRTMFSESSLVIRAELIEVNAGLRYYGPDAEAPDATAFEQVELVFAPVEVFKGDPVDKTISIPWTAYTTRGVEQGAERVERVVLNGLMVNERSVGQQYGLFIKSIDGVVQATSSEGIVPLNPQGRITGRDTSDGGVLVHDLIGMPFTDAVVIE